VDEITSTGLTVIIVLLIVVMSPVLIYAGLLILMALASLAMLCLWCILAPIEWTARKLTPQKGR